MFEDSEEASDVDDEFLDALTLLHSTEDDSAEKLRKMLDASIERKYGFDKILMARIPKKLLQNTKTCGTCFSSDQSEKRGAVSRKRSNDSNVSKRPKNLSLFVNNTARSNWTPMKSFDAEIEDYSDKGDIPRISIPDEGSADGLLCKMPIKVSARNDGSFRDAGYIRHWSTQVIRWMPDISGAGTERIKEFPENECQEVYHPLCHQPPVVDIDVYDPRIVWRCGKCTDAASVSSVVATDEKKPRKFRQQSDTIKPRESSMKTNVAGKLEANFSKNETSIADQPSLDCFQMASCTGESIYVKNSTQLMPKVTKTVSSNHLRKRIGSKLSVTRSIAKQL